MNTQSFSSSLCQQQNQTRWYQDSPTALHRQHVRELLTEPASIPQDLSSSLTLGWAMAGATPLLQGFPGVHKALWNKVWEIVRRAFTARGEDHHWGRQEQELCHSPAHTPYCLPPAKLLQRLSLMPNNTSEEGKKKVEKIQPPENVLSVHFHKH